MSAGISLPQFDSISWYNWAGILKALLTLYEAEDVFNLDAKPTQVSNQDWDSVQRRTTAYLYLYVKQDVYSLIADDVAFPTLDHSGLTCYYCQKKGHIKPDCCKKKKDEAEKSKKEGVCPYVTKNESRKGIVLV
jgi:hypothetical protein